MKPGIDELREDPSLLGEFNRNQIDTIRREAEEVKRCFTTQMHQALIVSAAIMGLGAQILKDPQVGCHILVLPCLLVIILCLTTAGIGCHKYGTSNRDSAYEIHLSRVVDYEEHYPERGRIARALRRIDWEEAMFAWRIIQPAMYRHFYVRQLGSLKRFKWGGWFVKGLDPEVIKDVEAYPWYDTRELLAREPEGQALNRGVFYPGTYLRKMLNVLYIVALVCWCTLVYSLYEGVGAKPPHFSVASALAIGVITSIYCIRGGN
jgi:hypothetical protein